MTILDTSVVVAFMDRNEPTHLKVADWLDSQTDRLVTTPLALAEMDHLLDRGGGHVATQALWANVEGGVWEVRWWATAVAETLAVARANASLRLGLTDCSLMALAAHSATTRIATLDERHFRAVHPLTGEPWFTVLPADAPVP